MSDYRPSYQTFRKAVEQMRFWQRQYFKTRDRGDLMKAKDYETRVDRMLDAMTNPPIPFQPGA